MFDEILSACRQIVDKYYFISLTVEIASGMNIKFENITQNNSRWQSAVSQRLKLIKVSMILI